MKLYHNVVSTCSQKVRLVLAEKNISYESEFLDLQRGDQFALDYLKLNANAVVPTLEDGGRVYVESTLINEYLDDAYPEIAMKPADAAERHLMRHWCKRIDDLHPACGVQTYAIAVRPALQRRPVEEVTALVDQIP
ncbi:MAG: glutathione S-transferase family protein, partial [Gammaproteobacteria bacterium]|nr:glutathione S-transferase family protein [Gammaproteobacteria bacterium]